MKPRDLVVRCYAETTGGQWQAICIDLNLAAQGDTLDQARAKLTEQILDYVSDAVAGEDKEFVEMLLDRPAPLKYRFKYHLHNMTKHLTHRMRRAMYAFELPLPLVPQKAG